MTSDQLSLVQIFDAVDDSADELVEDLLRLLRQPSVTADQSDCRACAEMVADLVRKAGLDARLIERPGHNPVVFGWSEQTPDRPTLLVSGHYDVVPTGPEEDWRTPPFAAVMRDGDITARGACDPKGNVVAGIKAAQLWQRLGALPINLKFVFEGDDEGPGDHLEQMIVFADEHRDLLEADAVLLLDSGFSRSGHSPIHLGTAGSLALKLSVTTGTKPPAFIRTPIVPDAAFRLVWALASLKQPDEQVAVHGFYDDVRRPTAEAEELLKDVPWRDEDELAFWGIDEFVTGVRGVDCIRRMLYAPTCSIHGFGPGVERPNADSMIPSSAHAWVNFHLVPDQNPDDIFAKVRRHLDELGFGDVVMERFRSFAPIAGRPDDSPLGNALLRGADRVGVGAYLLPDSYELGDKWCCLGQRLGVEGALVGIGDPDRCAHMPNEHITIDYFVRGIKWVAASYWEYAQS